MIIIVSIIGLLSMLLASIPKTKFKYGLECAWLILFMFLAVRYDMGSDYMVYYNEFNQYGSYSNFTIDESLHSEPGWQLLCRLFYPVGFFSLVAVLTAFECFVFYNFIKQNVSPQYYWISIFLFVFTAKFMLVGASMMRQELAIAIFVYSLKFIRDRKFFYYILSVFIATQIHSSAVILYPIYFLRYINSLKWNNWICLSIVFLYIVVSFFISDKLNHIVYTISVFLGQESSYDIYTQKNVLNEATGIGVVLTHIVSIYFILCLNIINGDKRLLLLLYVVGLFIYPFTSSVQLLTRMQLYFSIYILVCLPTLFDIKKYIKKDYSMMKQNVLIINIVVIIVLMSITIKGFADFFENPIFKDYFSSYNTIFSVL